MQRLSRKILVVALLCTASMFNANAWASLSARMDDRMGVQAHAIQLASLRQGMSEFRNVLDKARNVPVLVSMITQLDPNATDLRGRTIADDFRDYVLSRDELSQVSNEMDALDRALSFKDAGEGQVHAQELFDLLSPLDSRRASIAMYWDSQRDVQREQRMWIHSLERNHLNINMLHNKAVVDAEAHLRTVLLNDSPVKESWQDAMKEYISALIDDRNNMARHVGFVHANNSKDAAVSVPASGAQTVVAVPVKSGAFVQAKLKHPLPNLDDYYPAQCQRNGEEGIVILAIQIDKNGTPIGADITGSSGSDSLDDAALVFFKKLTFEPARMDQNPVSTSIRLPINFKLDERRDYASKKEGSTK